MAKMPVRPTVNSKPVTKKDVQEIKKDRSRTRKTASAVGHGLGLFVSALAAAGEVAAARDAEAREIDREIAALADRRNSLYGVRSTVHLVPTNNRVQWDHARPSHLLNCTSYCMSKHCLDCGDMISNWRVRCYTCD